MLSSSSQLQQQVRGSRTGQRTHALNTNSSSQIDIDKQAPLLNRETSKNSDLLTQDSILRHVVECKMDNKLRLKEVKNLEDLISFKIKTVSDKLVEEGAFIHPNSKKKGFYDLRKVVDPLLTSKAFPANVGDFTVSKAGDRLAPELALQEDSLMIEKAFGAEPIGLEGSEDNTKTDERKIMTETGTILIGKETANQQIENILKLDERDPIRKLQMYFKDSHFGHDYTEDGVRIQKRTKAPKHKNYIMQRYENKWKRDALVKQQRATSQQNEGVQRGRVASRNDFFSDAPQPYTGPGHAPEDKRFNSMKQLMQRHGTGPTEVRTHERMQMSFGPQNGIGLAARRQAEPTESEQRLQQANFLNQLKQLQEMLKESMFDAKEGNEEEELEVLEKFVLKHRNEPTSSINLPIIAPKSIENGDEPYRRFSTLKKLIKIDQLEKKTSSVEDLVQQYLPQFGGGGGVSRDAQSFDGQATGQTEERSSLSTSQQVSQNQHESGEQEVQKSRKMIGREQLTSELLKGVDSDEEMLEQLCASQAEIVKLQKKLSQEGSNDECVDVTEYAKLRQLLSLNKYELQSLTKEQRELIKRATGQTISSIAYLAGVKSKDYVHYSEEQMAVYKLLRVPTESQKRVAMLQERRKNYEKLRDKSLVSQKVALGRRFERSAEHRGSAPHAKARLGKQPFSSKRFVEDIQQPAFDFKKHKISERLPQIAYGTTVKLPKQQESHLKDVKIESSTSQAERGVVRQSNYLKTAEERESQQNRSHLNLQKNFEVGGSLPADQRQYLKESRSFFSQEQGGSNRVSLPHKQQIEKLYYSSHMNVLPFPRRVPIIVKENNNVETDRNTTEVDPDFMRISGISPFRHSQRESNDSNSNYAEKSSNFGARINAKRSTGNSVNKDLSKVVVVNQTTSIQVEKGPRQFEVDLKEVRSLSNLGNHPLPTLPLINGALELSTEEVERSTKRQGLSARSSTAAPAASSRDEANHEAIDPRKTSEQAGVTEVTNGAVNVSRMKIDLATLDQKESTIISMAGQSEDIYTEEFVAKNSQPRGTNAPIANAEIAANLSKSNSCEQSSKASRKDSLVYNDSVGTAPMPSHEVNAQDLGATNLSLDELTVFKNNKRSQAVQQSYEFRITGGSNEQQQLNRSSESLTTQLLVGKIDIGLIQTELDDSALPKQIQIRTSKPEAAEPTLPQEDQRSSETLQKSDVEKDCWLHHKKTKPGISVTKKSIRNAGQQTSRQETLSPNNESKNAYGGGYESAQEVVDPRSFAFMRDLADSVQLKMQQMREKGWQAKRFKKFPRFSIYLQRDKASSYLESNYISLSNQMLQFLAEKEVPPDLKEASKDSIESSHQNIHTDSVSSVVHTLEPTELTMRKEYFQISTQQNEPSFEGEIRLNQNSVSTSIALDKPDTLKTPETLPGQVSPEHSQQHTSTNQKHAKSPVNKLRTRIKRQELKTQETGTETGDLIKVHGNREHVRPSTQVIDPFDRVLFLKNIDNAILTSFRTLSRQNNQISTTLKVIHNKFTPLLMSRHVRNAYKKAQQQLYSVSEVESNGDSMSDEDNRKVADELLKDRQASAKMQEIVTLSSVKLVEHPFKERDSVVSSVQMTPLAEMRKENRPYLPISHSQFGAVFQSQVIKSEALDDSQRLGMTELMQSTQNFEKTQLMTREGKLSTRGTLPDIAGDYKPMDVPFLMDSRGTHFKKHENVFKNKESARLRVEERMQADKQRNTADFGGVLLSQQSEIDVQSNLSPGKRMEEASRNDQSAEHREERALLPSKYGRRIIGATRHSQIGKSKELSTMRATTRFNESEADAPPTLTRSLDRKQEALPQSSVVLRIAHPMLDSENILIGAVQKETTWTVKQEKMKAQDRDPKQSSAEIQKSDQGRKTPLKEKSQVQVKQAKVDEYLGEYQSSAQPLHPKFKTSKVIFQVKKNQAQVRGRLRGDQPFQQKVRQSIDSSAREAAQEGATQLSLGTASTFGFNESLLNPKLQGRKSGVPRESNRSKSPFGSQPANSDINLKPKLVQDQGADSSYSFHLNAIIDQAHSLYSKTVQQPKMERRASENKRATVQVKLRAKSDETVSIREQNQGLSRPLPRILFESQLAFGNDSAQGDNASAGEDGQLAQDVSPATQVIPRETIASPKLAYQFLEGQQQKHSTIPHSSIEHLDQNSLVANTEHHSTRNQELRGARVDTANHVIAHRDVSFDITQVDKPQLAPSHSIPQMVLHQSPSHNSNVASSFHMAGRMVHTNMGQAKDIVSPDNDNEVDMTDRNLAEFSSSIVFGDVNPESGIQKNKVKHQVTVGKSKFAIKPQKNTNTRQTALIKQSGHLDPFVVVPQPKLVQNQSKKKLGLKSTYNQDSLRTLSQSVSKKQSRETLHGQNSAERSSSLETQPINNNGGSFEDLNEGSKKNEIASRIVQPQAAQRVRQMIDTLCMKEKEFIYQNPNVRDDCVGAQDTIFNLSGSHLVNRPGMLSYMEKLAKKNLLQMEHEAEFSGNSFLAGQKAAILIRDRRPSDIGKGPKSNRQHR